MGDNLQNGCDRADLVDSGYSVLHCAAKAGRASTVKYLLELLVCDGCDRADSKGTISADYVVDVNAKDDHGRTALHTAVRFCKVSVLVTLLSTASTRIDLYARDNMGLLAQDYLTDTGNLAEACSSIRLKDMRKILSEYK
jgi:ankyrin repeat protein